jgi:hypothetical protein
LKILICLTKYVNSFQTCSWEIFPWGTDTHEILDVQPLFPNISLDGFAKNGEWELMSTSAWREIDVNNFARLYYEVGV